MPDIVGLKNSGFDTQKFSKLFEENCGAALTAETILSGIKRLAPLFTGEMVVLVKDSGMYISETTTRN